MKRALFHATNPRAAKPEPVHGHMPIEQWDRFIRLSTAHITKEAADWLNLRSLEVVHASMYPDRSASEWVSCTPYGWIFYCPDGSEIDCGSYNHWPKCLRDIALRARSAGYGYAMLDCDDYTIAGLPTYEW